MKTHWYVVGDASGVRVLSVSGQNRAFDLIHQIPNTLGRVRNQELVTDKPGRVNKGGTGIRAAMSTAITPHDHQVDEFAHRIATFLDESASSREFDEITLVFPPDLLGQIRLLLTPSVINRVATSVAKDLTHLNLTPLTEYLREHSQTQK